MPTTPKLPLKLHERLGDDAMTELMALFGDLGAETRAAHQEVRDEFARLERRMEAGFAEVKQQVAELRQLIADLKPNITAVQAELIKWTFLFWLGTIGIVLLLIRFPG